MPSLHDLVEDVLLIIFEQLCGEGRPSLDLKSLRLVCRRFCNIASTLLFRHVVLDFSGDQTPYESVPAQKSRSLRARGLLDFFFANDRCRNQVQTVLIYRFSREKSGEPNALALCSTLASLLPSMPRLKHISISPFGVVAYDMADIALLDAIERLKLNRPFMLASFGRPLPDGAMHSSNLQLFHDRFTCLVSLGVMLPRFTIHPERGEPTYAPCFGNSSGDVAHIISRNPGFKDLQLRLRGPVWGSEEHELLSSEVEYAMEHIGAIVKPLRSLALDGIFAFTPKALSVWEGHWLQLQSLSLLTEDLARTATAHFIGRFPALRNLRIRADRRPLGRSSPFLLDMLPFLASLKLSELSLTGVHPSNLGFLAEGGFNLQRLSFHICEGPNHWVPGRGDKIQPPSPSRFTDILLSPERVSEIGAACPSLDWFALDVQPFHIGEEAITSELHTPMSGYSASSLRDYEQKISLETSLFSQYAARNILERFVIQEVGPDPIFTELARFCSLRHLRLYIHDVHLMPWHFGLGSAIRTFLWLRKHKEGVPLESLVIFNPIRENKPMKGIEDSPWVVYEMGEGKVHAEGRKTSAIYEVERDDTIPALFELGNGYWGRRTQRDEENREMIKWGMIDPEGFIIPLDWYAY
ncbi:hypothetical protein K491DRAFT_782397 [Lophiostoma macrostomum CBS 122681]|uniref:Uncharacterized protein n=1 Tax=Lophiostoma macrostomum CBS 122681 TaxID=1314788 RepID=A0A6A6SX40_9PLEO|nr:hypothetical protein K491DRAFT_782397 [Lophiostoma macrostomum CBS 122681]